MRCYGLINTSHFKYKFSKRNGRGQGRHSFPIVPEDELISYFLPLQVSSTWLWMCLVHAKIGSLVEIGMMWWKSWKFICVEKFWYDGKVGSLKKKFGTKQGLSWIIL
jgi:hypothetical protein